MAYNLIGGIYEADNTTRDITDSLSGLNYIAGDFQVLPNTNYLFNNLDLISCGSLLKSVPEYITFQTVRNQESRLQMNTDKSYYTTSGIVDFAVTESAWYQNLHSGFPQIYNNETYYIDDNSIRYVLSGVIYTRTQFASKPTGQLNTSNLYMTFDVVANISFQRYDYTSEYYFENFKIIKTRWTSTQINNPSNIDTYTFLKAYMKKNTTCCITKCCEPTKYNLIT
jgi:hypothetical protein